MTRMVAQPVYYSDTGCELFSECLHCPFPEDECPTINPQATKATRNKLIIQLREDGKTSKELAHTFHLTTRQISTVINGG